MEKPASENRRHSKSWQEYIGESILIVFSVLLALFLTEAINSMKERKNTANLLNNIKNELINNRNSILQIQEYNLKVLRNIDHALSDKVFRDSILSGYNFHLEKIAPDGVLYRYLEDDAWIIARNNNIMSKVGFELISALNKVYEDTERIEKVEDEVADIIFDRASRDAEQIPETLTIIRDVYRGWAVDRIPGLLKRIDLAVSRIDSMGSNN